MAFMGDHAAARLHGGPHTDSSAIAYLAMITIVRSLSSRSKGAFDGVTLEAHNGKTALRADLADQSQPYGRFNRLRDFGIELISVKPASEARNAD